MNQSSGHATISDRRLRLMHAASRAFSPGAPIDQRELFAGRIEQIRDVMVALGQKGQHVIIYGERGVGKTSLTNVVQLISEHDTSYDWGSVIVNCDSTDTFSSIWHKAFREMSAVVKRTGIGFGRSEFQREVSLREMLPETVTPDDIRYALAQFPRHAIVIIDEIDTIGDKSATAMMAHTIKNLSDHAIRSKLILVGVADSVEELISEHRSVERSLVQVRMPRMSREELFELMDKALSVIGMQIDDYARNVIAQLSHGLPHYTHQLGLSSALKTIEKDRTDITLAEVYEATSDVIERSSNNNQTMARAFSKATRSTPSHNLHAQVLLACALVETDGLGTFAASDVKEPLSALSCKRYDVGSYQRHLDDFSTERRGHVLKKTGSRGAYRYRFINPMLPPFAVIQGIRNGSLQGDALERFVLKRSMGAKSHLAAEQSILGARPST